MVSGLRSGRLADVTTGTGARGEGGKDSHLVVSLMTNCGSIRVEQAYGFSIEWRSSEKTGKKQREILSLNDGARIISLDDDITLKDGRAGKVLEFVWPYTEGRTTDVIHVHLGRSHGFGWIKHEELK